MGIQQAKSAKTKNWDGALQVKLQKAPSQEKQTTMCYRVILPKNIPLVSTD
jgi:hypothetical protein